MNTQNSENVVTQTSQLIQEVEANIGQYQQVSSEVYGVTNIKQAFPVASRPDIAFRPDCDQISEVWTAENNTVFVFQSEQVYELAGQHLASSVESRLLLSGSGICVDGGETTEVPLIQTSEVLGKAQISSGTMVIAVPKTEAPVKVEETVQAVVEAPVTPVKNDSIGTLGFFLPLVLLTVVGVSAYSFFKQKQPKINETPNPQQFHSNSPSNDADDFELEL